MQQRIAKELLAIAGTENPRHSLDLLNRMADDIEGDRTHLPKAIFNNIGRSPIRGDSTFLLPDVLESQMAHKPRGNCVGLTSLYTALAERQGIDAHIRYSRDHVVSDVQRNIIDAASGAGYGPPKDLYYDFHRADPETLLALVQVQRGIGEALSEDKGSYLASGIQQKQCFRPDKIEAALSQIHDGVYNYDASFAPGYCSMAELEAARGNIDEAHECLDISLTLDDSWLDAYLKKARLLYTHEDDAYGAREYLESAQQRNPNRAIASSSLFKDVYKETGNGLFGTLKQYISDLCAVGRYA